MITRAKIVHHAPQETLIDMPAKDVYGNNHLGMQNLHVWVIDDSIRSLKTGTLDVFYHPDS
jgi:hypothetical protein